MQIGELARSTGIPVETIRYYEREGLMPITARGGNNYRQYSGSDAERLAFIGRCRDLDLSLDEVRALLALRDAPKDDCTDVDALIDRHIGHVAQRIAQLQLLQRQLRALRRRCSDDSRGGHCGILERLERESTPAPPGNGRQRMRGVH